MSESRVEKRRRERKLRKPVRLILALLIIIVVLYLLMLAGAIFGGEDLKSSLREYTILEKPAEYVEQSRSQTSPAPTTMAQEVEIVITVSEDTILYEGGEVSLEELGQIVSERDAPYVVLVDDGAKRVTYAKVMSELERLGVIIEEK